MNVSDGVSLVLLVLALVVLRRPTGLYLARVLDPEGATWLDPVLKPMERLTYRVLGVDPAVEQDWKRYGGSLLVFSLVSGLFTYALLRLQHRLPLNPEGLGPLPPHLAFNTAVSFVTNTNWQSYAGESTMSYLSQMVALVLHNFASAAVGLGVAAALVRSVARPPSATLGNFWSDLVRTTYYLLLPLSLVLAVVLVSQGMIQNLDPYTRATLVESSVGSDAAPAGAGGGAGQGAAGGTQVLVQGPMASQVAIKMLGTNGGGYANANAAHPFENPTPLSNLLQMLSIFLLGSGLTHYLGRSSGNPGHGWAVWSAMLLLFLAGVLGCAWAEASGNPIHQRLGLDPADGNLEGKELRFGIFDSALFAVITTDASCGAVNAMHDSFTPLGGLVPLFNIQLGEVIFGGVGAGLYGMLLFVLLAVFLAGLMVGRSPEYLGKKVQAFEMKMVVIALLAQGLPTLGFAAWAAVSRWGIAGLNHAGPHGLGEILYAFTSAAGNNGSAFAGLSANTPEYSVTLAVAMLAGRFLVIIPVLALAGSLALKKASPPGPGTLPVHGATFVGLLVGTLLLVGALNYLPVLALGPVVEHFLMLEGRLF